MVCPVYQVDGRESMTARGRMHLLTTSLADQPGSVFEDLFSQCLLCTACEQVCPRNLPITDIISRARSSFSLFYGRHGLYKVMARSVLAHPSLLEGLVKAGISLKRLTALPADSGLRLKLGLLEDRPSATRLKARKKQANIEASEHDINYFNGCLARHLQPSVASATVGLSRECGLTVHTPEKQCCCGLAAWSSGKRDQARNHAQKNIAAFATSSKPILTSCSSCSSHLLAYPDLFSPDDPWYSRAISFAGRVREFTDFFARSLPVSTTDSPLLRVFYHDPCHLRFTEQGKITPRKLLKQMGIENLEPENDPACCGQGGFFHHGYPETAAKIFLKASRQALAEQPDCITTTCSGCLMQYQQGLTRLEDDTRVVHLALLLNEKLCRAMPFSTPMSKKS